jgi:hypothetical protein
MIRVFPKKLIVPKLIMKFPVIAELLKSSLTLPKSIQSSSAHIFTTLKTQYTKEYSYSKWMKEVNSSQYYTTRNFVNYTGHVVFVRTPKTMKWTCTLDEQDKESLVGNSVGKQPVERSRSRCDDNINTDLKKNCEPGKTGSGSRPLSEFGISNDKLLVSLDKM